MFNLYVNSGKIRFPSLQYAHNNLLCYIFSYRFANSEPWFSISDNGIISTNDSVDREHASINQDTSEYVLLVTATDDCELILLKYLHKCFNGFKNPKVSCAYKSS